MISEDRQHEQTLRPIQIHLFRHTQKTDSYAAGATIFQQGEPGDTMYIIIAGEVDILSDGVAIATCGVGELIGEMAVLDEQLRSATAVARTACTLAPIDLRTFRFLLDNNMYFALQVLQTLTTRLRGQLAAQAARAATIAQLLDGAALATPPPLD